MLDVLSRTTVPMRGAILVEVVEPWTDIDYDSFKFDLLEQDILMGTTGRRALEVDYPIQVQLQLLRDAPRPRGLRDHQLPSSANVLLQPGPPSWLVAHNCLLMDTHEEFDEKRALDAASPVAHVDEKEPEETMLVVAPEAAASGDSVAGGGLTASIGIPQVDIEFGSSQRFKLHRLRNNAWEERGHGDVNKVAQCAAQQWQQRQQWQQWYGSSGSSARQQWHLPPAIRCCRRRRAGILEPSAWTVAPRHEDAVRCRCAVGTDDDVLFVDRSSPIEGVRSCSARRN